MKERQRARMLVSKMGNGQDEQWAARCWKPKMIHISSPYHKKFQFLQSTRNNDEEVRSLVDVLWSWGEIK